MKAIVRFAFVVAASLALAGCYYTPPAGNAARASLVPKYVPTGLLSVAVVVTGPGMAPIFQEMNLSSSEVTLEIPSGASRTISLLLNTASNSSAPSRSIRASTCSARVRNSPQGYERYSSRYHWMRWRS